MHELYLGLVPGEAPIDRLVDGAVADPATDDTVDRPGDRIIGDRVTGAILGIVPGGSDGGDGLWRRLRMRWTGAHDAPPA